MVDSADGARLPACTRSGARRRIRHVVIHVVEAMLLVALVGIALLAFRLSSGPIYLEWLHDKIVAGMQERVGAGYVVELGPTYVTHELRGASGSASET